MRPFEAGHLVVGKVRDVEVEGRGGRRLEEPLERSAGQGGRRLPVERSPDVEGHRKPPAAVAGGREDGADVVWLPEASVATTVMVC